MSQPTNTLTVDGQRWVDGESVTDATPPPDDDGSGGPTPPKARKHLGFLPGLEGLRGFSLLIVLVAHTGIFIDPDLGNWLMPGGLIAMDIFFTLSGFLITALLLIEYDKRGTINVPRFLRKRARRLFPALILVLAAHWLVVLHYHRPTGLEWRDDLWALSMTLNYKLSVPGGDPLWGIDIKILWSLAIEGQFYLIWPFIFLALMRWAKSVNRIAIWLVVLVAACSVVRAIEFNLWGWRAVYFRSEGRFDAFFMGGLLSLLWYHDKLPMQLIKRLAWPSWAVFLAALWFVRFDQGYLYSWGMVVFNILGAVIIAGCFANELAITRVLALRGFRLGGRVSYSFYMVHMQVYFWVITERTYLPMWQRIGLAWLVTLLLGSLSYAIAERPFLGRPSLKSKRSAPPAGLAPGVPAPG